MIRINGSSSPDENLNAPEPLSGFDKKPLWMRLFLLLLDPHNIQTTQTLEKHTSCSTQNPKSHTLSSPPQKKNNQPHRLISLFREPIRELQLRQKLSVLRLTQMQRQPRVVAGRVPPQRSRLETAKQTKQTNKH